MNSYSSSVLYSQNVIAIMDGNNYIIRVFNINDGNELYRIIIPDTIKYRFIVNENYEKYKSIIQENEIIHLYDISFHYDTLFIVGTIIHSVLIDTSIIKKV
jgi:hypothetical protein